MMVAQAAAYRTSPVPCQATSGAVAGRLSRWVGYRSPHVCPPDAPNGPVGAESRISQARVAPRPIGGAGEVLARQRISGLTWRGLGESAARALADTLARRDAAGDHRRMCVECANFAVGYCARHRAAGLLRPDIGQDLATLLQTCPAFNSFEVTRS